MAVQNLLIMNLLRIITPEEIADIATKHNGGKFLSLTDLVTERVERKIYRDFSGPDCIDEIHEAHSKQSDDKQIAKILPFNLKNATLEKLAESDLSFKKASLPSVRSSLTTMAIQTSQIATYDEPEDLAATDVEHKEDENMSTFIMVEKARLKNSQKTLKQKEIIDLYQKNSSVDVEQIKSSNAEAAQLSESGVLVNKKQF